ncbi:MAG: hypothetical protein Q9167_000270 [Letrouitia subvulpina]
MPFSFSVGKKKILAKEDGTSSETATPDHLSLVSDDQAASGLWQEAWKQVKGEIKWELPEEFGHLETLKTEDEVKLVQRQALDRRDEEVRSQRHIFGSKHTYREVYDKIAKCCDKFQVVGDLVAQAEPVYAALPWTCVKFFITCAIGESEVFHTMLDGVEEISEDITNYPVLEHVYARINSKQLPALQKSILHLYKSILLFQLNAIKYFDPHKKALRSLSGLNPFKSDEVKGWKSAIDQAKQKVDQHVTHIDAEVTKVGIDNLLEGQAGQKEELGLIKGALKALSGESQAAIVEQRDIIAASDVKQQQRYEVLRGMWKEPLDELRTKFEQDQVEKEKKHLQDVRTWLSIAEPERDYTDAKAKRPLSLGWWLVKHDKFEDWLSTKRSSILWLHGFAGTGKTSLACRVIDHLQETLRDEKPGGEAASLAFFFFSSDKAGNRGESSLRDNPEEAFRSIVSQLATWQQGRVVAKPLQEKFDTFGPHSDKRRKLNLEDCAEILAYLSKQVLTIIVLDAFDECERIGGLKLIQQFQSMVRESPENLKIFISTRSLQAIEDYLTPKDSIEVTAQNNGEDVEHFIKKTLQDRIDDQSLLNGQVSNELKNEIETVLIERAHNMFLYGSLLLQQLADKNHEDNEESIRKKLKTLPPTLTDAFDRIMLEVHDDKNNSEESCRIAQDTFKWLLHTQRTLNFDEFLEAVSGPGKKTTLDEVQRVCRTLVVPSKTSFEFAHYSVREHLGQIDAYSPSQCHLTATKSCLRILSKTFGTDISRDSLSCSEKSFEQYAVLYWPLHYESIDRTDMRDNSGEINTMLRAFLLKSRGKKNKYERWFALASEHCNQLDYGNILYGKLRSLRSTPLSPIFAACLFGLDDLINKFGRDPVELNRFNSAGQSALCLAIESDKLDTVKALLSSRFPADVNLFNERAVQQFEEWNTDKPPDIILYASALQCAAARGQVDIAKLLIAHGAHIDLVAGYFGSPLQAAAHLGRFEMVQLLLKAGAEPNSQGGFHGNALQAASVAGHTEIVSLLLEHKPPAALNTPGGRYGSALMAAIYGGHIDTVFTLLEEKADPSRRNRTHGTPLEKAAGLGYTHQEIVKDLLEYGAETDLFVKGQAVHVLHRAARFNMQELATYCLDKNCNVNMVSTEGPEYPKKFGDFPSEMTPLAYACAEGHVGMADLLIGRGAHIERGKDPSAVLWIAAYRGHPAIVDLLISKFKALHPNDKGELARFLDQKPHPRAGHQILWVACTSHSPDVVRILLESGAEYRSNWYGSTPLLATATYGCPKIAELLLQYPRETLDVHINERARNGRTALFEACALHRPRIVRMLLDAGADYLIPENENATTIHLAAHNENPDVMEMLLSKASKEMVRSKFLDYINTQHRSGKTALIDCAERGHVDSLRLLLSHGADFTLRGNRNRNPLNWAARNGHTEIVTMLLDTARERSGDQKHFRDFLDNQCVEGKTPLMEAAENNQILAVQRLLDYGADYTIGKKVGVTPLHAASWNGFNEVAVALLNQGSQDPDHERFVHLINRSNDQGKTALIDASETGRDRIVAMLLENGADYTIQSNDGFTALHWSAFRNRFNVVRLLLEKAFAQSTHSEIGQDEAAKNFRDFLNHQSHSNKATALRDAAIKGHTDVSKLLLSYGANLECYDSHNHTPFHYAIAGQNWDLALALLENAQKDGDKQKIKRFLNAKVHDGTETAWESAKMKGPPRVVEALERAYFAEMLQK